MRSAHAPPAIKINFLADAIVWRKSQKDNLGTIHSFSPDGFILIPMGPILGTTVGGRALVINWQIFFKFL